VSPPDIFPAPVPSLVQPCTQSNHAHADMALEFENPALVVIWLQHFTSFFLAWKHTVIASNLT